MNGTVPRHDVVLQHAAAAHQRRALLAGLIGLDVLFRGERNERDELVPGALYRERIGCRCRIVGLSEHESHCPLVVEWPGGEKGIAEPEWLTEVAP